MEPWLNRQNIELYSLIETDKVAVCCTAPVFLGHIKLLY